MALELMLMAVGERGTVITSANGTSWSSQQAGVQSDLRAVAYGNGKFLAVGPKSVVSDDGLTWRPVTIPTEGSLTSVIYAAGRFTAADDRGKAFDSADGATWTAAKDFKRPFEQQPQFRSVASSGSLYVLMTSSGAHATYGTRTQQPSLGWNTECFRVIYLAGQFLQLCEEVVITGTSDGSRWERRDPKTWGKIYDAAHDGLVFRASIIWHLAHDGLSRVGAERLAAFRGSHSVRSRAAVSGAGDCSRVNQVEIFFSILHRRCLKYGSFTSAEDLRHKVLAFIRRWNEKDVHAFDWCFRGYPIQSKAKAVA